MKTAASLTSLLLCLCALAFALPSFADTIIYSEGFDTDNGGYTHNGTSDDWQWGTPQYGPPTAHSGTKCWGTNLTGSVPLNASNYLYSPAIPIPALGSGQIARVRFYGWIAVDEMYDRGEFAVSSDRVNWTTKLEMFFKMNSDWAEYDFNVSNYAGGNLYLRWHVSMDSADQYVNNPVFDAGLYIDDVAVTIVDEPSNQILMTMTGNEDQSTVASCPWLYSWDGKQYVQDNDVYSVARRKAGEYTDYYRIMQPLVEKRWPIHARTP